MTDVITLTGIIGTVPRNSKTPEGLHITSFRLASTQRRFDRGQQKWVDAETNWFSINAFRQIAANAATSLNKGDRVIVTGRVRVRPWEKDGRTGTSVEVDADALGHDLFWGTSSFVRTIASGLAGQSASAATEQTTETFGDPMGGGIVDDDGEAETDAGASDDLDGQRESFRPVALSDATTPF